MKPLTKGEKMVLRFLRNFAFNINSEDFRCGMGSTRKILKSCNGSYKKGLFFKTLLAEVSRDIDWKLASEMEDAFATRLG